MLLKALIVMGATYSNISLSCGDQAQVIALMEKAEVSAKISPVVNGKIVVALEEMIFLDPVSLQNMSNYVSSEMNCPVLGVTNFDDDALTYVLSADGEIIDSYTSDPSMFSQLFGSAEIGGGDAVVLSEAFGVRENSSQLALVLGADYVIEMKRHNHMTVLLNLPEWSSDFAYGYLMAGDDIRAINMEDVYTVTSK